jgi:hypothetical protein
MKQSIMGAAQAALEARRQGMPGISIAEFMYIAQQLDVGGNIKELSALLDYLQVKSEQRIKAEKESAIQLQNQGLAQIEQQKAQAEQAKDQRQTQREMSVEKMKGDQEIRKILVEQGRMAPNMGTGPSQAVQEPRSPVQGSEVPLAPQSA